MLVRVGPALAAAPQARHEKRHGPAAAGERQPYTCVPSPETTDLKSCQSQNDTGGSVSIGTKQKARDAKASRAESPARRDGLEVQLGRQRPIPRVEVLEVAFHRMPRGILQGSVVRDEDGVRR